MASRRMRKLRSQRLYAIMVISRKMHVMMRFRVAESSDDGPRVAGQLGLEMRAAAVAHEGCDLRGDVGVVAHHAREVDGYGGRGVDKGAVFDVGVHVFYCRLELGGCDDGVDRVDLLLVEGDVAEKEVACVARGDGFAGDDG